MTEETRPKVVFPDAPLRTSTPRDLTAEEIEDRRMWDEDFMDDETP